MSDNSRNGQVTDFERRSSGFGVGDGGCVDFVHLGQVVDICKRGRVSLVQGTAEGNRRGNDEP